MTLPGMAVSVCSSLSLSAVGLHRLRTGWLGDAGREWLGLHQVVAARLFENFGVRELVGTPVHLGDLLEVVVGRRRGDGPLEGAHLPGIFGGLLTRDHAL